MGVRVPAVPVLVEHVTFPGFDEFSGVSDGLVGTAFHHDEVGPVGAQQLPSLLGSCARQANHHLVPVDQCQTGEADAGVARGSFNHRLTGHELARLQGVVEHEPGRPVFDRTGRVEPLQLGEQPGSGRCKVRELNERGISGFHIGGTVPGWGSCAAGGSLTAPGGRESCPKTRTRNTSG